MVIKGQDIVVVLKLLSDEKASYLEIGDALSLSPSQVHDAVSRLSAAGLVEQVNRRTRRVVRSKLRTFIETVVPDAFPAVPGPVALGMPTSYATQPLSSRIAVQSQDLPPVWPDADGPVRGCELKPIHRCAPFSAKRDPALYELLALVDAVRSGRARERKIAMEELGARIVEPPNQAASYPHVMRYGITEETINQWAQTVSAQSVLPDLIRRLILFFVPPENIRAIDFPAYSADNQPGLDGEVETATPVSLLADTRVSAWEISVEKDIKRKAVADFNKYESGSPLGHTPSNETYIALTGRIWRDKKAWVQAAKKEKRWASVRAYDATDIAQWLALAPAVRAWFSDAIGQKEEGVEPVETFFAKWTSRTHPPLSEKVVVAGRDPERQKLVSWLNSPASPLLIRADTAEECVIFLCGVLLTCDAPTRDVWLARTLILRSPEAWNRVLRELNMPDPPSMILVPAFDSFDGSRFGTGGHHLLIPHDRSVALRSEEDCIDLHAIDREELADALNESVIHDTANARTLAYECGGSLTKLQRLLGYAPKPPSWANESPDLLCAMLLAGAWDPRNEADLAILSRLAGTDNLPPIEDLAEKLLHVSDPPLRMQGDIVNWRSARDVWDELSHLINPRRLERFVKVATDILSKRSPRFELPPDERSSASIRHAELAESKQIRTGLAESVAWVSTLAGQQSQPSQTRPVDFTSAAKRIVGDVLKDPDWRLWATLNESLQVLAESAPETFLCALETVVADKAFTPLFAQDARENGFFCECAHAGLLWALEVLAWNPAWFNRVVRLLARLAQFDPGGQYSNRPIKTLEELFHPCARRSWASNDQWIRGLEQLTDDTQSEPLVWRILLKNLTFTYRGGAIDSNKRPRFLDLRDAQGQRISEFVHYSPADTERMMEATRKLILVALDRQPTRIFDLIRQSLVNVMHEDVISWMERHLLALQQWSSQERSNLIRQIRVWASATRKRRPDDVPETELKRAETLAGQMENSDPVVCAAWLFCDSVQYVLYPEKTPAERDAELERLRMHALAQALQIEPRLQSLICLTQAVSNPWLVGLILSKLPTAEKWEQPILEHLPNGDTTFAQCAKTFFISRGDAKLLEGAQHLASAGKDDAAAGLLLAAPSSPNIRDWLRKQGKAFVSSYWKRVNMGGSSFRDTDDFSETIASLLSYARLTQAFIATDTALTSDASLCPTHDLLATLRSPFDTAGLTIDSELTQIMDWSVPRIFKTLDTRSDIQPMEIATLEIPYIDILEHSERSALCIFGLLSQQPELFVSLVTALYRPASMKTEETDDEATMTLRENRAHHAFRILNSWSDYPGQNLPPAERDTALRTWCDRVLEQTVQADRRIVGEHKVGEVLARVPPSEADGVWPCLVAREHLRSDRTEVGVGLSSGRFNSRGVRSYTPGNHHEERDLAKKFENDAERIRAEWPETASLLDSMAQDYRQWADQLDRHDAKYTDP